MQDVDNLYKVPLRLEDQHVSGLLLKHFNLKPKLRKLGDSFPLTAWTAFVGRMTNAKDTVQVAVAGKYTKLSDAYLSLLKVGVFFFSCFWNSQFTPPFRAPSSQPQTLTILLTVAFTKSSVIWRNIKNILGIN